MSAVMSRPAADFYTSTDERSVDELDAAIGRLVRQMNADSYRMLVLVREFDDRFGWKKWTFKTCAEWLAWRRASRCRRRARRCARRTRCDRCRDLGGVRRRALVVFEGQRAHARRPRA